MLPNGFIDSTFEASANCSVVRRVDGFAVPVASVYFLSPSFGCVEDLKDTIHDLDFAFIFHGFKILLLSKKLAKRSARFRTPKRSARFRTPKRSARFRTPKRSARFRTPKRSARFRTPKRSARFRTPKRSARFRTPKRAGC